MSSTSTERVACDDGTMDLHLWVPDHTPVGSVLVLQEIFGVGGYIRDVCQRLRDAGYMVGAPDVFWRFSPNWEADHTAEGLEQSFAKVGQLDFPQAIADCTRALNTLAAHADLDQAPAVLGFCLGGTLAWGVAIHGQPSACVSYYGSGVADMIGALPQVTCPTLFHFGSDDPYISSDAVQQVAEAIAGHPGFVLNVEQAGHAFDNHHAVGMFYVESAAQAAWAKTMAFLDTHAR